MRGFLPTLAIAILLPAPAFADEAAPPGTVYQLSPQEVTAIKDRAAQRSAVSTEPAETIPDLIAPSPKRPVHGEIGFGIGTGGYRSVFGTVVYPVGDEGFVAFSFANSDFGNQGRRTRRR